MSKILLNCCLECIYTRLYAAVTQVVLTKWNVSTDTLQHPEVIKGRKKNVMHRRRLDLSSLSQQSLLEGRGYESVGVAKVT